MVKKLVKKGLVEKKKDESNKSRNILNLTEKGEKLFVKINTLTIAWEREITKNLDNDNFFKFKNILFELTKESANLG